MAKIKNTKDPGLKMKVLYDYINEGLSIQELADRHDLTYGTISQWIVRNKWDLFIENREKNTVALLGVTTDRLEMWEYIIKKGYDMAKEKDVEVGDLKMITQLLKDASREYNVWALLVNEKGDVV